jgi:ribosomal-protein-alanine N-acetyltransferase
MTVRDVTPGDLPALAAIQQACPEAAQWNPADYLQYQTAVAVCDGTIVGFLVSRSVIPGEREILNLAVAPAFRRRGIAKTLISEFLLPLHETLFLEVRASNRAAQNLYVSLGFQEVARRPQYYDSPPESAIVMKFHSC